MLYYITPETSINAIKILALGTFGFVLAFIFYPSLIDFLHKRQLWRKEVRKKALGGGEIPVFQKFHTDGETRVPRFGGLLIWIIPLSLAVLFSVLSRTDFWFFQKLNFLSRSQTWLPLFALVAASLVGLLDDFLQTQKLPAGILSGKISFGDGLKVRHRLILMGLIGLAGAWWFYDKLGWSALHIPGAGDLEIGVLYIPLFILVMLAVYSGGVIDGLDGLAGGAFAFIFAAFAGIALFNGQIDIAAFSAVMLGALLAFLWFNIPPAKFYMGETGMMGLCATVTVIAFLTDSVLVLPIIGFLLVLEASSVILQLGSKKLRQGKKLFLAAPIHLHLEAKGWPYYQITMRFWIIGMIAAIVGLAIRLLG